MSRRDAGQTVPVAKAKGRPMLSWVDLVEGTYDLEAPVAERPATVRVTDMLGEETLVVEES